MTLTETDARALADAVRGVVGRYASITETRSELEKLALGGEPPLWAALVDHELHALHLPTEVGGGGAGLAELAVVARVLGGELAPGPWLATVLASAALQAVAPEHPVLGDFAGGARGALVRGGLVAAEVDGGWRLDGVSDPALGVPGARYLVIEAALADGLTAWLLSEAEPSAVAVDEPVDLTRSVGRVLGAELGAVSLLAVDSDGEFGIRVALLRNALFGAEAAGVMATALRTAVDHVATREQFGQPVGAFQAVQHKAAMMLINTEVAAAAAWDAARAAEQPLAQQQLAAASAAITAVHPAVEVTLEAITLLGGVGFTWEHDAHLYWRRAISLAALVGERDAWEQQLGACALEAERDFSFLEPDTARELRAEIGPVLDRLAQLPDAPRTAAWRRLEAGPAAELLADARLVAPHYPAPFGRDADVIEQAVIAEEFAARGLAVPSTVIGEWVLPTLLQHGDAAQQERFVDPTLRGHIVWCQLFSEPGAGSDLASLTTRAVKVDGGWRLQGQKVWTSGAHLAHWGVCLARTDAEAPKHKGISYFLLDMSTPGIDVRPLRQATGRAEFNEVFLDDVFVPDECLVGQPGDGWRLTATTLGNERVSIGSRFQHGGAAGFAEQLRAAASVSEAATRALGRSAAREIALSALGLRSLLARAEGREPGAEVSVAKVFSALAQRANTRDQLAACGAVGAVAGGVAAEALGVPAVLFGGGTVEIQLNVIAQRVLRMPR
ncbi:acyl-CoA dehydrogenase family protein [Nocardioides sp. Bht2]|uniref:acyl-CoA dehydrogenase family protein n=1 Tax=Nocardioides sp. Bht2 TaxID=3392297 RepID=UPI0039B5D549